MPCSTAPKNRPQHAKRPRDIDTHGTQQNATRLKYKPQSDGRNATTTATVTAPHVGICGRSRCDQKSAPRDHAGGFSYIRFRANFGFSKPPITHLVKFCLIRSRANSGVSIYALRQIQAFTHIRSWSNFDLVYRRSVKFRRSHIGNRSNSALRQSLVIKERRDFVRRSCSVVWQDRFDLDCFLVSDPTDTQVYEGVDRAGNILAFNE